MYQLAPSYVDISCWPSEMADGCRRMVVARGCRIAVVLNTPNHASQNSQTNSNFTSHEIVVLPAQMHTTSHRRRNARRTDEESLPSVSKGQLRGNGSVNTDSSTPPLSMVIFILELLLCYHTPALDIAVLQGRSSTTTLDTRNGHSLPLTKVFYTCCFLPDASMLVMCPRIFRGGMPASYISSNS